MMLLDWPGAPGRAPGVALVFGTGLVGGAVIAALRTAVAAAARPMPWSWPIAGTGQSEAVERATIAALAARPGAELAVIWAAGQSGFSSDDNVMYHEAAALEAVIATARRILAAVPERRGSLHHVSSAGGLFEGQVACGPDARPHPLRPYAVGKLAQEAVVMGAAEFAHRRVYRPSSVYGFVHGGRRGLIPVLIASALARVPARIVGALTTLRDYVHAADVGRHIAAEVARPCGPAVSTALLAQGRGASIFEILHLVEAQVGLPVRCSLDPRPENARNSTFLRSALPRGFQAMSLGEGIARTALALRRDRPGTAP
ncbi:MAG: NAD-dependent epimerase/dehydratase family protein [Alkalilacustris sp.]